MAGFNGNNFYFSQKQILILTELADNLLHHSTNYSEALKWANIAQTIQRNWVLPLELSAGIHFKKGDVEKANSIIDKALQIRHFYSGFLLKGDIFMHLHEWVNAEKFYSKALDMEPSSTLAKIALGNAIAMTMNEDTGRFKLAESL